MVQKQVRGDQIDSPAGRSAQPVEHVQFHRLRLPGERFEPTTRLRADDPLSIHEFDFHIAPLPREPTRHAQHQCSVPSAQIHQPARGTLLEQRVRGGGERADISHQDVHEAQIPARMNRPGIVGR